MAQTEIRRYEVEARSTDTFGRVLCGCRNHHFVVDGPVQNGCPGEAVTPAELFLSGVAACGVELLQVIAKERGVPLESARVMITGEMDRANPVRPDVALFNTIRLRFDLQGVTPEQGAELVAAFKGR
ncbi:MAG TPA: OsmC family protein [Thermoplasmata archaeon]|nr:OsmC family protein [Thermoplasmata archaeon]